MALMPYLFFEGRCDEAIEFYRGAVGADVKMLMRYKDNPEPREGQGPAGAAHREGYARRIGNRRFADAECPMASSAARPLSRASSSR